MENFKSEIDKLTHEELKKYTETILEDCIFYRSIFETHSNSAVFNLKVKTINGKNVWVDPVRDSHEYIKRLDKDEEVERWLQPVKASR
jgi:hypothetical protein